MTHFEVLMHELAQHGSTTYAELMARYGDDGYGYSQFTQAVERARALGIIAPGVRRGKSRSIVLVATGACPCCGRQL